MTYEETLRSFFGKVRVDYESGCWEWTAGKARGYGHFSYKGKAVKAHRWSVENIAFVKIPEGLTLDHLCRRRSCVNPAHLEIVTIKQNILRGESFAATNARKKYCIRGHPLSGDNLHIRKNGRGCRRCKAEWRTRKNQQSNINWTSGQ